MATGQLIFQPLKFDWHSEDQQTAFEEWKGHIILMLEASNIPKERCMPALLVFLGQEGFRQWQHLDILKDNNMKKDPNKVFKAFTKTLEVSTSQWNHIDEMYSDIRQGEHKMTDQLDQHIKILAEKCSYTEAEEKKTHWKELLFHATKHFKVKKWVDHIQQRRRQSPLTNCYSMPKSMRQQSGTSTDTSPMEELQWQPP